MGQLAKQRGALGALALALLVHALLLLLWRGGAWKLRPSEDEPAAESLASVELVADPQAPVDTMALLPAQEPATAMLGASDFFSGAREPAASSASNAPGTRLGVRAPGERGAESFSDRSDPSYRSKSFWNTPGASQMAHTSALPKGHRSPEALEREPDPAFANTQQHRRQARLSSEEARRGLSDNSGQGGAPGQTGEEWFAIDPRFDEAPTARTSTVAGSLLTTVEAARSERGAASADNQKRGPAEQAMDAPARSNRSSASAFDLGAPSAGGESGLGAGGKRGASTATSGGTGTAAHAGEDGDARASTQASRTIPYFYSMYRRIDKELRFPKKLALDLEQGETILSFTLDETGRVRSLQVSKSSGFKEFDAEAKRAFLAAAPFGRVPPVLLRGKDELRVIAPYYFRNPLIR